MSYQQRPSSRRDRRAQQGGSQERFNSSSFELPGPLRFISNPKVFLVMGLIFGGSIILSLAVGLVNTSSSASQPKDGVIHQANEAPDVPRNTEGTTVAAVTVTPEPTSTIKRYTAAPPFSLDPSKKYTATIQTSKGEIVMELYPDQAPQAVNAFVFLANDGYYDKAPFMDLGARNSDGSMFTVQTGDPTGGGLGTPGFNVAKEVTSRPFDKGAVGMDSGQFFFSLGDYPALNSKYTIIGKVVSGFDVLSKLALEKPRNGVSGGAADSIQSVTISTS